MQKAASNTGGASSASSQKTKALLFCSAFVVGCSVNHQQILHKSAAESHTGMVAEYNELPIAMLLPHKPANPDLPLRIYIEGDGRAWITKTQPSLDPTPRDSFMRELAIADDKSAIYLARPCQYKKNPNCNITLWTNMRFSQVVLDSMNSALEDIKHRYQVRSFELVGYSGGATAALLLAAQRDDVSTVQTIAGNISPTAWIKRHRLTPLNGSLVPTDFSHRLKSIPQRHFFGAKDQNIPPETYLDYLENLDVEPECSEAIVIPDATHDAGWTQAWQHWSNKPVICRQFNQ